jgi:alkanesulfonate monooxygenase SsuD/methylene tetrahydromethanopterin reductase-like flavin-dependent oxidoreductase (luciferase family)
VSSVRVGAVLSPVADWGSVIDAAKVADELGFEAVGLWDHYHSERPEWAYVCGWSAYGAIAAVTERLQLVPMVLNNLHYELGVVAKESSVLAIASKGRFQLGLGAGDWPASFAAWGKPFPSQRERFTLLEETVAALRMLWRGAPVTYGGGQIQLDGAICTPAPPQPPRVVVGCGKPALIERAVAIADELNVYADGPALETARAAIERSGRPVELSTFVDWSWDKWPADPIAELEQLGAQADRVFVSLGSTDMPDRLRQLASARVGA